MTTSHTGGCACGAVRYAIAADPMTMLDCQCRQCQKDSGTGHSSHMFFARAAAEITGATSAWSATGENGLVKSRAFCPICGTSVFTTFPAMADVIAIRPGSLDDPSGYQPQLTTWTSTGQAWDRLDPNLPGFAKMPPQ